MKKKKPSKPKKEKLDKDGFPIYVPKLDKDGFPINKEAVITEATE